MWNNLELRAASVTPAVRRELKVVFPGENAPETIIFTFQDSYVELLEPLANIGAKDLCLLHFFEFSYLFGEKLEGYWWDYIDPCSGYPMRSEPAAIYSDVDVCHRLLHMPLQNIGNCWMISHPVYSTRAYIASFLTSAPLEVVNLHIQSL